MLASGYIWGFVSEVDFIEESCRLGKLYHPHCTDRRTVQTSPCWSPNCTRPSPPTPSSSPRPWGPARPRWMLHMTSPGSHPPKQYLGTTVPPPPQPGGPPGLHQRDDVRLPRLVARPRLHRPPRPSLLFPPGNDSSIFPPPPSPQDPEHPGYHRSLNFSIQHFLQVRQSSTSLRVPSLLYSATSTSSGPDPASSSWVSGPMVGASRYNACLLSTYRLRHRKPEYDHVPRLTPLPFQLSSSSSSGQFAPAAGGSVAVWENLPR